MSQGMTISELLAEYREAQNEIDRLNQALAKWEGVRDEVKARAIDKLKELGLYKKGGAITEPGIGKITVKEEMVANYKPELFKETMAWMVETGNEHLLQRRFTNKAVNELIEKGVPLPDGLSVVPVTSLSFTKA